MQQIFYNNKKKYNSEKYENELEDEQEIKETKELKENEENKKSYLLRFYEEAKNGVKKNYKTIIFITIVSMVILYMNYNTECSSSSSNSTISKKLKKMLGGDNEGDLNNNDSSSKKKDKKDDNTNSEDKKKKKGFLGKMVSPLDGANSVMWWIAKNIALLYMFLIFLVAIPTVPAILYITLFYFIMSGMLSKLGTI